MLRHGRLAFARSLRNFGPTRPPPPGRFMTLRLGLPLPSPLWWGQKARVELHGRPTYSPTGPCRRLPGGLLGRGLPLLPLGRRAAPLHSVQDPQTRRSSSFINGITTVSCSGTSLLDAIKRLLEQRTSPCWPPSWHPTLSPPPSIMPPPPPFPADPVSPTARPPPQHRYQCRCAQNHTRALDG